MIDKYTAQAPTKDQAIEKGLDALGITKEDAIIEVTKPGKKGFLGIGQQDAVVTVKRKKSSSVVEEVFAKHPLEETSSIDIEEIEDKNETDQDEESSKKEDNSYSSKEERIEEKEEIESHSLSKTNESSDQVEEEKTSDQSETETVSDRGSSSQNKKDQEGIEAVKEYLYSIVQKMGVEDAAITITKEAKRVRYNIDSEDAGLIIGRHGKVLNGLQTLAQIQLHQLADSKFYAKVDAENYRERRKKTVEQLARRTADKVKQTNRPVILEPMPAHERKQIHRYLNTYAEVQTHSEGKEPHRYLVVEPAENE